MGFKELISEFGLTVITTTDEITDIQTTVFISNDGLLVSQVTLSLSTISNYFGKGLENTIVDQIRPKFLEHKNKKKYKETHMFDNITVIKSPNADSRSANEDFSLETLSEATDRHIMDVQRGLALFANFLNLAGDNHDFTKKAYMEEFYSDAKRLTFGDEFKNGRWYQMHIVRERHHLASKVPDDVNLIDVLEYLTDGVMAGMARSLEVYDMTLPDELLQKAYKNTVELLKSRVKVVEESV